MPRSGFRTLRLLATFLGVLLSRDVPAQPVITFPGGDAVATFGDDVLTGGQGVHRFQATTGALLLTYAEPASAGALFGHAIATVGGNVLVGAPQSFQVFYDAVDSPGSAHLYDGTTGALLLTLAPTQVDDHSFGWAVAALGDDLLVGAPQDDTGALHAGAVYLFDGTTGALLSTFHNPSPSLGANFGYAVAAVGGDVLVGVPALGFGAGNGKAYLLDGTTGAVLQTFAPSEEELAFAAAVASFGGDALIVSPRRAMYVFEATTGALSRTFSDAAGVFGPAVAVKDSMILVGRSAQAVSNSFGHGAVLIDGTTGAALRQFDPVRGAEPYFGTSVAIVGDNALVGAAWPVDAQRGAHLFCGGTVGCGPCETCDATGGCVVAPSPTCRPPSVDPPLNPPRLKVKNPPGDGLDRLLWRGLWSVPQGGSLALGDFGYPARQDHTLCAYDESASAPTLLFRAGAPAGGACPGRPSCWRGIHHFGDTISGFRYVDRARTPDGIQSLLLRNFLDLSSLGFGDLKAARIALKAAGPTLSNRPLGLPALPLPLPLRLQLQAKDGMCWEARYSEAGLIRNTPTEFEGRPD